MVISYTIDDSNMASVAMARTCLYTIAKEMPSVAMERTCLYTIDDRNMPSVAIAPPINVVVRTPSLSVSTPDTNDIRKVMPMVKERHRAAKIIIC